MPSARELKMRQLLEQKKQAILAQQAQAAKAQKANPVEPPPKQKKKAKPSGQQPSQNPESQQKVTQPEEATAKNTQPPGKSDQHQSQKKTNAIFQAIGTVCGKVKQDSQGKFLVEFNGLDYYLSVPRKLRFAFVKEVANNSDQPLFLRVYPQCWGGIKKTPRISFKLCHWSDHNQWRLPAGVFTLRGVWHDSKQFENTTMVIYRNQYSIDPSQTFLAAYLPIRMERDDDARPFQYNRELPKKEQPPRYFCQGIFQLDSESDELIWLRDIAKPTTQLPKYQKPRKFDRVQKSTRNKEQKNEEDI